MSESKPAPPRADIASRALAPVAHRSGAVAHMLQMPVATLRVWERRYGLTQHPPSPGGQRLYADEDLSRLTLIKQLTDMGHPIGTVATLDLQQLQGVVLTHTNTQAATQSERAPTAGARTLTRPWRLAVVGAALGSRLQRPGLLRRLGRSVVLLGPFGTLAQATRALRDHAVDTLLLHEPQLLDESVTAIHAAQQALGTAQVAVLYGFAAEPACEALADGGVALLRDPQPDAVVSQWLRGLAQAAAHNPASATTASTADAEAAPQRRWDAATLTTFAGLSSTIACECPRHLAELLMQLHHFEDYSAACEHRHTADAQLHAYLHQVAATSRALFEVALERVALHEGLPLPAALSVPQKGSSTAARKAKQATRTRATQRP